MKTAPFAIASLLAFGVAMSPDAIGAGPHDLVPPTNLEDEPVDLEQLRAGNLQEMQAWLRRLVGRYRQYNVVSINGVLRDSRLSMDCIGIGSGPGVHCMQRMVETDREEQPVRSPRQDALWFSPDRIIFQFGINLNASEIQMFTIHNDIAGAGILHASAQLRGDTLSLSYACPNTPQSDVCRIGYRFTVPVDGEYVLFTRSFSNISTSTTWQFFLYRVSGDESSAAGPPRISLYDDYLERMKPQRGPR